MHSLVNFTLSLEDPAGRCEPITGNHFDSGASNAAGSQTGDLGFITGLGECVPSTFETCIAPGKFDTSGSGPSNIIGRSVSVHTAVTNT